MTQTQQIYNDLLYYFSTILLTCCAFLYNL